MLDVSCTETYLTFKMSIEMHNLTCVGIVAILVFIGHVGVFVYVKDALSMMLVAFSGHFYVFGIWNRH